MSYLGRKFNQKEYISNPEKWVRDILPLKRKKPDGEWDLGFLRRDWFQGKWQTVLIVYNIRITQLKGYVSIQLAIIDWGKIPQKQYANVDMILKDGWEVD